MTVSKKMGCVQESNSQDDRHDEMRDLNLKSLSPKIESEDRCGMKEDDLRHGKS